MTTSFGLDAVDDRGMCDCSGLKQALNIMLCNKRSATSDLQQALYNKRSAT